MSQLGRKSPSWAATAGLGQLVRRYAEHRAPRTAMMVAIAEGVVPDNPLESIEATSRACPRGRAWKARRGSILWQFCLRTAGSVSDAASRKKGFSPPAHYPASPAPKTGPPAQLLPRGPSGVGGARPPRRLAPRIDSPPAPPPPASRSTLAATMALPRAPARPQVPKPPAWRQNYRAAAGWACSALKIVQKCPHC